MLSFETVLHRYNHTKLICNQSSVPQNQRCLNPENGCYMKHYSTWHKSQLVPGGWDGGWEVVKDELQLNKNKTKN